MNRVGSKSERARQRSSGISLLETVLCIAILGGVLSMAITSADTMRDVEEIADCESSTAIDGIRAYRRMIDLVRHSGQISLGGEDYPIFFENGGNAWDASGFQHAAPHGTTGLNVVSREMIFLLPQDADGDLWPDLDGMQAAWSPAEHGILLVPQPDGQNHIEYWVDGEYESTLARGVRQLLLDDSEQTGFQIPLNCLRMRLQLGDPSNDRDANNRIWEEIIRLRN